MWRRGNSPGRSRAAAYRSWSVLLGATRRSPSTRTSKGARWARSRFSAQGGSGCSVQGQYDEHGRNRQANWYYFRMDGVKGREIYLTLTDLVGEYDDKPGACPMNADTIPGLQRRRRALAALLRDGLGRSRKEATLRFRPEQDRIWIAHVPPYTHSRLLRLLEELDRIRVDPGRGHRQDGPGPRPASGHGHELRAARSRQENGLAAGPAACLGSRDVVCHGRGAAVHHLRGPGGRELAREGGLQVHADDGPGRMRHRQGPLQRQRLRREPALGRGRPPAQGRTSSGCRRSGTSRRRSWATVDSGRTIDLLLNLHNTETAEYLETQADDPHAQSLMSRFFEELVATTTFDPSQTAAVRRPARPHDQLVSTASERSRCC